ncbi:unnamed protein product [Dracunculus medinensis]|uniref:Protein FAM50 homolog n=1 Tax=Dracunculus medinensis TaxID=318479 RepID=A0A0N4U1D8_DRAME|nr:unnamed protein product [Dracunculus medinensis]
MLANLRIRISISAFNHFASNSFSTTGNVYNRAKYIPRRALLYVPGSNLKMLQKVPQIKVDSLVLELEDGVAMNAKADARTNVKNYLDDLPNKGVHRCFELGVRINSVSSQLIHDDLKELAKAKHLPHAFMVPKVDSIDDLAVILDAFKTTYGEERISNSIINNWLFIFTTTDKDIDFGFWYLVFGISVLVFGIGILVFAFKENKGFFKDVRLVIWIESARAILDMPRIINAAMNLHKTINFFKLDAAVFGSDDFCADIGATRTKEGYENIYARQRFVTCCKAFGIQAIDSVYIDIKDIKGLKKQCEEGNGVSWGFDGKQSIHPSQIETILKSFLPSQEKIEWAQQLVKEFMEHEKRGEGAFTFRGQMIDRPLLLQAMNLVNLIDVVNKESNNKSDLQLQYILDTVPLKFLCSNIKTMSKADEGRLIHIAKKRERAKEAIEQRRRKIELETKNLKSGMKAKFTANYDTVEECMKSATVGLVTLDEMREKQKDVSEMRESQLVPQSLSRNEKIERGVLQNHRLGMDPTVETAFLPDRERESELTKLKDSLAKEWHALQEKEKNEEINVAFAYWDGSSHRKDLRMKKGNTISQFLARALELLKREFSELRSAVPESLMFVKEDLIIPHFYTFQDFIVTKAMGKTGPLYEFDAAGEIRLRQDAAVDCGESHPAKVVLRNWYEKNKHIYPASRWEAFVPNKEYRQTVDDLTTI